MARKQSNSLSTYRTPVSFLEHDSLQLELDLVFLGLRHEAWAGSRRIHKAPDKMWWQNVDSNIKSPALTRDKRVDQECQTIKYHDPMVLSDGKKPLQWGTQTCSHCWLALVLNDKVVVGRKRNKSILEHQPYPWFSMKEYLGRAGTWVATQWSTNTCSGHVVVHLHGRLNINNVAQEIRVWKPLIWPVICKEKQFKHRTIHKAEWIKKLHQPLTNLRWSIRDPSSPQGITAHIMKPAVQGGTEQMVCQLQHK